METWWANLLELRYEFQVYLEKGLLITLLKDFAILMLQPLLWKRARSAFRVESDLGCTGPQSDGAFLRFSWVM